MVNMKKKIIIAAIAVLLVGFFLIRRGDENDINLITAESRELVEEVFETGAVKSGSRINLSFQSGGTLNRLPVAEGDYVEDGHLLASLDRADFQNRVVQAQKAVEMRESDLLSATSGSRSEEISNLENRLAEAEESLEVARRAYDRAVDSSDTGLSNIYSQAPSLINDSYLLSKELKDSYKLLRSKYFSGFYLSDTYRARDMVRRIERSYEDLRDVSSRVTVDSEREEIDTALSQAKSSFLTIERSIETIIEISETDFYERRFSSEDSAFLWETKKKASEMLSGITKIIGEIESIRQGGDAEVISAESNLKAAESRKKEIEDNLRLMRLGARDFQVSAAEAALETAKQDLEMAVRQLSRTDLTAPVSGIVSDIHLQEGEEAAPNSPVVTILSDGRFYVEVDIYEGDIPSVNIGDPVIVEFVAFLGEFTGEVTHINESGRVIDGIVSFRTEISIESPPERLMNEMTADVTIQTERKESLSLPREAVRRDGARRYVVLFSDGEKIETDVEVGITDSYGNIEIVSGISEGDRVVID